MGLVEKVDFVAHVFGDRIEVEVPLLRQVIVLLLVVDDLAGEELDHITECYLVALVWIQDVKEIVGLLIQILLEALILRRPVGRDVRDLEVHARVQVNELLIRDDSIMIQVDLPEERQELAQELFMLIQNEFIENRKQL